MILKNFKRATFLCPAMTTGGPEAIHQAAQAFNEVGLRTDIAYYGNDATIDLVDGDLVCSPPRENPCLTAYAQYQPVVSTGVPLRARHLLVLPEVLAGQFATFKRATVGVWWLSVDNALPLLPPMTRRALFGDRAVLHFHQSAYAADFLRAAGVPGSAPLGDFTTAEFTDHEAVAPNPGAGVAHNPAKGADLAQDFFGAAPDLAPVPVRGMSRTEAAQLFRRTSVYVDFGHLPGKDRMPREAAASGTIVFLRALGAGRFAEDFPVPDFFRFTDDDVRSGELARRVRVVQEHPLPHWQQQQELRDGVRAERAGFRAQVAGLRAASRAA